MGLSRATGLLVASVLFGGLVFLQVLDYESGLLSCFAAYGAIALAAFVGLVALRSRALPACACLLSTGLLFSYVLLRALCSPDPYVARFDFYLALGEIAVYALAAFVLTGAHARIAFLCALLSFAVVHVVVGVVQAGSGQNFAMIISALGDLRRSDRGAGLFVNPDHLAGFLELVGIIGINVAAWSRWPSWTRVVVAYLAGLCYFGLVLTGSRGGYLSVVASIVVFAMLSLVVLRAAGTPRLLKSGAIGLGLFSAALFSVWVFIQRTPALSARTANTFNADQGRIDLWHAAIEQWRLNPLFGTGSGTYLFYGRLFRAPALQLDPVVVHNDYLHLLCEYGLIGTLLFAVFLVVHLRSGWQTFFSFGFKRVQSGALLQSNRVALSIAALCSFAAYAVHSLVDFNMHIPANALLVAFIFGTLANSGDTSVAPTENSRFSAVARCIAVALALVLLVQSARLWPGEASVEAARVALRDENPEGAVTQAEEAVRRDDRNPLAFFYLGRALAAIGSRQKSEGDRLVFYEKAGASFEQSRRLSPMDVAYPLELARLYDFMGRYEEAEWMFFLARERDPRSENVQARYEYHLNLWRDPASQTPR